MHMYEENWDLAQTDFFEAFKNYDEAGSPQRLQCLKYLVLASMLADSTINPFESQETKPYANNPHITVLTTLVDAYQRRDVREFQKILRKNEEAVAGDVFMSGYISDVLRNIRMQFVAGYVKPYHRITLKAIADVFFGLIVGAWS